MTVPVTTNSWSYFGNGVTLAFAYTTKIFSTGDLVVNLVHISTGVPTLQALGVDYTVSPPNRNNGGNVTFAVAPPATHRVDIRTLISLIQSTSIKNQGAFNPEIHETVFDRLLRICQQQQRQINNTVHIPDFEVGYTSELPKALDRANGFLKFDTAGNVVVVQFVTAGLLNVTNFARVDIDNDFAGVERLPAGSAGLPSLSFTVDPNTGLWRAGTDTVAIGGNGAFGIKIDGGHSYFADGAANLPSITFDADFNTGLFRGGADDVRMSLGGITRVIFNTAFIEISGVPLNIGIGAVGSPGLAFDVDTNTGLYRFGVDQVGITGGGVVGLVVGANTAYHADGANNAPSITWIGDSDSGFFRQGSGEVRYTCNGSDVIIFRDAASGALAFKDPGGTYQKAGYRGIPQNSQSVNYTAVMADAGKQLFHPSGAGAGDTFTIPANASVAYDIGETLSFINEDASSLTIAINSDTLILAGAGTTGSRSLAQHGIATAVKITSTSWIISGTNLT